VEVKVDCNHGVDLCHVLGEYYEVRGPRRYLTARIHLSRSPIPPIRDSYACAMLDVFHGPELNVEEYMCKEPQTNKGLQLMQI